MKKQRRKEWHEYVSTDTHITEFKLIDFPTFKLKHDEVTINDIPDPKDCLIEKINHFALTFNAYNDKELHQNAIQNHFEYFEQEKHKNSLKHLRGILFFEQRAEHMKRNGK